MAAPPSPAPPPGRRFVDPSGTMAGGYRLVRPIAWGGMGVIYLAEHPVMGARAAAKVLKEEYAGTPEIAQRFIDEARVAAMIRHPNSVQIYDLVRLSDDRPCIVMEYLDGQTLESCAGRVPMAPARAVAILVQVCDVMQAMHERGIVHRDIKAENILLVTGEGGAERVKLLDFGIAKLAALAAGVTDPGAVIGTPYYMAPEQAQGLPVDSRADLYSVGVLAYRLLAGEYPFEGQSPPEVMYKQVHDHARRELISLALQPPVFRALAKRREDRFASAGEFAQALRAALERQGPPAPEPSAWMLSPSDQPGLPEAKRPPTASPLERLLQNSDRDHYAFLGLPEDAEAARVRVACRRVEEELSRARERARGEQRTQIAALFKRLGHAEQVLQDLEARAAYDARRGNWRGVACCIAAGLAPPSLEALGREYAARSPEKVLRAGDRSASAEELASAREWGRALEALEQALSLDPLSAPLHRRWADLKAEVARSRPSPRR